MHGNTRAGISTVADRKRGVGGSSAKRSKHYHLGKKVGEKLYKCWSPKPCPHRLNTRILDPKPQVMVRSIVYSSRLLTVQSRGWASIEKSSRLGRKRMGSTAVMYGGEQQK